MYHSKEEAIQWLAAACY